MWILKQENEKGNKYTYLHNRDFNKIIKYINTYSDVKKIDDYKYIGYINDEKIIFTINFSVVLDND